MSSSEEESGSEVEEVEEEEEAPRKTHSAPKKPVNIPAGLDEASVELLDANRKDRERMEEEINELRARAEKRKKQRAVEEKRHAKERADEEERRKAVEEEKKHKREEEEINRQHERAKKMAEFEKLKNPGGPNFVISKKDSDDAEEPRDSNRKSKEQLEAEKKAILGQRIVALQIDGFDASKLTEKSKELHKMIYKLENEKYDLEKQFKMQQSDLMELAEKARKANKVGKGGLKRVQAGDEVDMIQARFTGAPAKIEMYSKYERQKDKREYGEKKTHFSGPQFLLPAERIKAAKKVSWDEEGMPIYGDSIAGQEAPPQEAVAAE